MQVEPFYIFTEFVRLFSEMGFVVLALLVSGIVLIGMEFNTPQRGRFGLFGALLLAVSVVLRMLIDGSPAILFWNLCVIVFALTVLFALSMAFQKTSWVAAALKREELQSVPDGTQKVADYSFLLGAEGTTTSLLAPSGQMILNNINFFVTSDVGLIDIGRKVRVVEVRGEQIIVQEQG